MCLCGRGYGGGGVDGLRPLAAVTLQPPVRWEMKDSVVCIVHVTIEAGKTKQTVNKQKL